MFYYWKNLLQNKFDGVKLIMNVKFKPNAFFEPDCVSEIKKYIVLKKVNVATLHILIFYSTRLIFNCTLD